MNIEFLLSPDLSTLGVVPVLVGPLQALLAILPALLVALGGVLLSLFRPSAIKNFFLLLWRQKFIGIGLSVLVWCALQVLSLVPGGVESVSALDGTASSDWSMHRGNLARRGATLIGEDPGHGNIQWSFSDDGIKSFYSSPAIVGNRIYATSARWELFKKDGAIYSLDADTGKLVWKYNQDGYRATFSSPSISGKHLVVGEGLHLTKQARIFCLDIDESERTRKGVKLWEFETNSHVESSPCIADGKVFCGAGGDGLYCLELVPNTPNEPNVLWHLDGKEYPDCETSPVYYQGNVYFGLGIGGQGICCVDANSGEERWRIDTPYPVFSSPSIYKDLLFIGMGHGDFVNKAETVATLTRSKMKEAGKSEEEIEALVKDIRPVGEVWCVDLKTQSVKWKFPVARTVLGSVSVADDRIYFGSRDKHMYCVSLEGELIKKWNARAPIITSPAIGKSLVYAVTEAGRVVGLDKNRLSLEWDVSLNSPSFSSPAVGSGHVYVGTNNNGLLCVGEEGFEQRVPEWRGERGGPGISGANDGSFLPQRGKYAWSFKGEDEAVPKITAPLMHLDGAYYCGLESASRNGLLKVGTNEKGSKAQEEWFVPSVNPVTISAAGHGSTVYFVDGTAVDADRKLRAVSAVDGTELANYPIGHGSGKFMLEGEDLLVVDQTASVTCLHIGADKQLALKWQWQGAAVVGTPVIDGNYVLVATGRPALIYVLDRLTGSVLLEKELKSAPRGDPIMVADRFWTGTQDGIIGMHLTDNEDVFIPTGAPRSPLVANNDTIAFINDQSELLLVDAEAGQIRKRIADAKGSFPPLLTDTSMLFLREGALMYYDIEADAEHQWSKIKANWPGNLATEMIMIDSLVLFATELRGIICMKAK